MQTRTQGRARTRFLVVGTALLLVLAGLTGCGGGGGSGLSTTDPIYTLQSISTFTVTGSNSGEFTVNTAGGPQYIALFCTTCSSAAGAATATGNSTGVPFGISFSPTGATYTVDTVVLASADTSGKDVKATYWKKVSSSDTSYEWFNVIVSNKTIGEATSPTPSTVPLAMFTW